MKGRRRQRTRAKIFGTADKPRLNVSKSLKHIYLQLIDDTRGITLVAFHTRSLSDKDAKLTLTKRAELAGQELAKLAGQKGIQQCVFDKGPYRYHGKVAAVAKGARQTNLNF